MSYVPVQPGSYQALAQASGIGAYENSGDWTWMFNPYEYSFLNPADSKAQPAFGFSGLSGCGCGGKCGGCGGHSHDHGLGQGLFNTGLFESTDISTWGWGEWGVVAAGVYLGVSVVSDVIGAGRSVGSAYQSSRRTAKRRAQAQADMF
jgi:hypothetical protein